MKVAWAELFYGKLVKKEKKSVAAAGLENFSLNNLMSSIM